MRAEYLREVIEKLIAHGTIGYIHEDKHEEIFGSGTFLEQREMVAAFDTWKQLIIERINHKCPHTSSEKVSRGYTDYERCTECGAERQYISNPDDMSLVGGGYWTHWQ